MNDIVEFIKKRRKCFKNSCLSLEPLSEWITWASREGTLFYSKTDDDLFNSIGIAWRVNSKDHSKSTMRDFVDEYNPSRKLEYDVFVLDFFAENKDSRNQLATNIILHNIEYKNMWAIRQGKTVKINSNYLSKLYKI